MSDQTSSTPLAQKLWSVYQEIDAIEKRGENEGQHYKYVKAVHMVRALRAALIKVRVYAEVNFDFVGPVYTIARAKFPNAPFSAVNVKCSMVFRDLDTLEKLTGSGLGTGADTGDKAVYKAQTGALKYALRNAFLVPDEADPEADPQMDENATGGGVPDLDNFQAYAPAPKPQPKPQPKHQPTRPPQAEIPEYSDFRGTEAMADTADPAPAPREEPAPKPAPKPSITTGDLPAYLRMPTKDEFDAFRKKFMSLGDELADKGGLKSSRGKKINTKLKIYMESQVGVDAMKMNYNQLVDFTAHVNAALLHPETTKDLVAAINRANGE